MLYWRHDVYKILILAKSEYTNLIICNLIANALFSFNFRVKGWADGISKVLHSLSMAMTRRNQVVKVVCFFFCIRFFLKKSIYTGL